MIYKTVTEFKESTEYAESMEKIKGYSKGYTFSLKYEKIPKAKANALIILTKDCIDMGILESISMSFDIAGNLTEETYKRL